MAFFNNLIAQLTYKPSMDYCEKAGSGLVARPGYAISNLLYIIIGIIILVKYWKNRVSRTFGFMTVAVGLFSFVYDTAHVYWSQLLDLTAMFVFIGFILTLNIKRLANPSHRSLRVIYALVVAISVLLIYIFRSFSGDIIFGIFIVSNLLLEFNMIKKQKGSFDYKYRHWILGVGVFLVGIALWFIDFFNIWCDPTNLFNGRGIFHYLGAIGVYFLFKFYQQFKFITVTRNPRKIKE